MFLPSLLKTVGGGDILPQFRLKRVRHIWKQQSFSEPKKSAKFYSGLRRLLCLRRSPERAVYPHHIGEIFRLGAPNILMQSAYTFYIFGLNLILAEFSDRVVTVLGLYYKWQSFFIIPLGAMQTCIVPVISFNYAARNIDRCKKTLLGSVFLCQPVLPPVRSFPLLYIMIPSQWSISC